jgi:hypothetical protein
MFELEMLRTPGFIVSTSCHDAVMTPNKFDRGLAGMGIACLYLKIRS